MSQNRKGILKRPAPAPKPFFSFTRDVLSISRLLGPGSATQSLNADGELGLKRAHFIIPDIRVVYPISSDTAPSSTTQSEARLEIDAAERLRRETEQQQVWTAARVEALYRDICKIRDEKADPTISAQIRSGTAAPKILDLSRMRLTFDTASALADLLALDWGLQRLVLSDCDLDDLTLKPILHAILIPDSLAHLALANNKRLRFSSFKMIATFLGKSHALEFIDLSMNVMDKRAIEAILGVLPPAPPAPPPPATTPRMSRTPSIASIDSAASAVQFSNPFEGGATIRPTIDTSVPRRVRDPTRYPESPGAGPSSPRLSVSTSPRGSVSSPRPSISGAIPALDSPTSGGTSTPRPGSPISTGNKKKTRRAWSGIKFDECALKGPGLEALAHAIRTSQIQTVSLRGNKVGSTGAVAIALMIKDYPDQSVGIGGVGTLAPPVTQGVGGGRASVGEQTLGLGLGLGSRSQTPTSSAPPSPRPSTAALSAPTGSTGPNQGSSNHIGSMNSRPSMASQSSLTTVSTFKERDITSSPPTGNGSLANGLDNEEAPVVLNAKPPPPFIAPKPAGLQARLAGAVAAGNAKPAPLPSTGTEVRNNPPVQLPNPSVKPLAPPPRHPAVQPPPAVPGTNYTPYVPRVRRAAGGVTNNASSQPSSGTGTPSNQQGGGSPAKAISGLPGITPGGPTVQASTGTGAGMIPVPYTPRQTPLAVRLQNAARAAASQPSSPASRNGAPPPPIIRTNPATRPGAPSSVTMITSSSLGGVTTRLPPNPSSSAGTAPTTGQTSGASGGRPSAALMDIVRSMEGVPKLGCLVSLDLKSNDVRGGVSYIAQVLKRNRTLKTMNLSDNRIDVQGLVQLAEALKYNSTLTSLDLSNNPCSSPSLEGIHVLRNALTLNTTLHYLSLSSTGLTPQGAIALAEFIPDFPALQHLDLTSNTLDVAGVLALSVGLKVNYEMRCLDLSIVPGEEEMARLCREILKICLRNTERAQATEAARAGKVVEGIMSPVLEDTASAVWEPIEHSTLARDAQVNINATAGAGVDPASRIGVWKMNPAEVISAARSCADDFAHGERGEELVKRTKEIRSVLVEMIRTEKDEGVLGEMLALNDGLVPILAGASEPTVGLGLDVHGETPAPVEEVKEDEAEILGDLEGEGDGETSPAENLSRSWVAEEGEILRKSRVLLSPNELESESGVDSEALRQELLEAQVERAPARVVEEEPAMQLGLEPEPEEPEPEPEFEETMEGLKV
ncbi:protein phosphatase 1 regulatory subunit 37, putative [Rhizoctonia solani AG-3 Rhs1AP]|uniref:Protein phosphatase 1 regulatory subunit 37, putative n=1 Tax=Rhizoctonia solani AG-3 Rhs1AP TaxID=1086054 RepID=X8J8J9_9AGAM|nr:protein phosphatase 1 regulatory subunit 37, putative [Rhizoctonia solani AG-3 Rhs1AP]